MFVGGLEAVRMAFRSQRPVPDLGVPVQTGKTLRLRRKTSIVERPLALDAKILPTVIADPIASGEALTASGEFVIKRR